METFFILLISIFIVYRNWYNISIAYHLLWECFVFLSILLYGNSDFNLLFCLGNILLIVAYNDYTSYYFSKVWLLLLPVIYLLLPFHRLYVGSFLCVACICVLLYRFYSKYIGSADLVAICIVILFLGIERTIIAVIVSCVIGIGYFLIKKSQYLPFMSFLSVGIWLSILKGYTIWYKIISFLS